MALAEELARIATAAAAHAEPGETVTGVVAAEPASGERVYLCSFEHREERSWLALDESGTPLASAPLVREAASIAALTVYDMCKALDKGIEIREVVLRRKSGGKSGDYVR